MTGSWTVRIGTMALFAVSLAAQEPKTGRTIEVPLDHRTPGGPTAPLYFELGAAFDRAKPVVIVVADGQQYYVRKGAVPDLQKSIFGDRFNVVGIVGRGRTDAFVNAALGPHGEKEWEKAWTLFRSEQWIEDIDAVRKAVAGKKGRVMLYGRSGGAYLVHQYLQKHSEHVHRAFTSSAVSPCLNEELGVPIDTFWDELDAQSQAQLRVALERHAAQRQAMLMALQRQHFFVPTERIHEERAALIRALAAGDAERLATARREYQVDDVLELVDSPVGMAQMVRVLEFLLPMRALDLLDTEREKVFPTIEPQRDMLRPLLRLLAAGRIRMSECSARNAHQVSSELFVLAGLRDEAVDYRTSMALASAYPNHRLFIADDNHVFQRMTDAGLTKRIVQEFLLHGLGSEELGEVLEEARSFRWNGRHSPSVGR